MVSNLLRTTRSPDASVSESARAAVDDLASVLAKGITGVAAAQRWEEIRATVQPLTSEPGWAETLLWLSKHAYKALSPYIDTVLAVGEWPPLAAEVFLHLGTDRLRVYQAERTMLDELQGAVAELDRLVAVLPKGHHVRPAALTNLSVALLDRSRTDLALLDDLDRAVSLSGDSVKESDPSDPAYPSRINNHGSTLRDRYQEYGVIGDLMSAVTAQEAILDHPAVPNSQRAMFANNIGQGLRDLYEVTGDRVFLKRAMRAHRIALRRAHGDDTADLPRILSYAGITQRQWRRSTAGISQAITWQRQALDMMTGQEAEWGARMGSLAISRLELARVRRSADDVTAALGSFDRALVADGRTPDKAVSLLRGRAEAHEYRWRLTGNRDDLKAALAGYDRALEASLHGNAITVLDTARSGGMLAAQAGPDGGHDALSFFRRGLRSLNDLLARQVLRRDQRGWQQHADALVASTAVAYAARNQPREAVDVLDSYRARETSMLATFARIGDAPTQEELGERGRLLREARQAVFAWLRDGGPVGNVPVEQLIARALGPSAAVDIRTLIAPPSAEDQAAATGHYIAYLVTSELGGAVALVRPDRSTEVLSLPRLTEAVVRRRLIALRHAYDARRANPAGFEEALATQGRWVGPLLVGPLLGLVPEDAPLVLIPCGPLAELPLLSASLPTGGRKGDPIYPLLGRPVTFAASVRTLRPHQAIPRNSGTAVAIDGESAITRSVAAAEAEALSAHTPPSRLAGRSATAEEVTGACADCRIVHFSCHGIADRADPVRAAIHLGGATPLTLADITRGQLRGRPLVVLASCESAAPDPTLPDQTFGLPAAFLHSGADMVIAPTYAVSRHAAALLAVRFYWELAHGWPPHAALAHTQRWIATATGDDKVAFIHRLANDLNAEGLPADGLITMGKTFRKLPGHSGTSTRLTDWCLFMAHA